MSLKGNATALQKLRGKINGLTEIYYDTYQIAVKNGFKGTVDEWLDSLGDKYIVQFESLTDEQKAELKGEDGYTPVKGVDYFDGKDGADGKTPVKGTDYFTESEKEEIASEAASMVTAKDVTSDVSVTSYGTALTINGATDNGNTVVISATGGIAELSISVENHNGICIGGCVHYYNSDDNTVGTCPLMYGTGTTLANGISMTSGSGSGELCIVLYYT